VEAGALAEALGSPWATEALPPLVVVDPDGTDVVVPVSLPVVVAATAPVPWADVVLDDAAVTDAVATTCERSPITAVSFVLLLRSGAWRSIEAGLVAESTTYSMLQGSPEFARWRASRPVRERGPEDGPPLRIGRDDRVLRITLDRAHVHNAFSPAMRDALAESFHLALVDDTIEQVVLDGDGPSFCSGGDLDTFGTFPDIGTAHLTRLTRSPARLLAAMAERVEVRLHGSCLGAGIELSAFAGRVIADPGTRCGLPEVPLGLVPGAGGTVSLPRRIGPQRTALLGLTGRPIDATTALEWGLVDGLDVRQAS
jgi:enoyl-CoA hydratase/carnithine racemase